MTDTTQKKELIITRLFEAPIEKVWKAWTEPEQMMKWWGPKDFIAPEIKIDFKEGGKYLFCMQGPDGKKFWSTGTYKEIVPMTRLVSTDSFSNEKGEVIPASDYGMEGDFPLELLVTITFKDLGEQTKMTLHHSGLPAGQMEEMTSAGWNQSFDKLAESLK